MQLTARQRGFSLTELAVVFTIVALLIGGALMTLSARIEQRDHDETMRRLNAAAQALLAFAIVNGRLPCPATAGTTGDEAFTGGNCTTWYGGFLPARTIGFELVDAQGYGLDAWNNRIRYAVSQSVTGCTSTPPVQNPHFVSSINLKLNGVGCRPNDLDICAPTDASTACTAANRVVSTQTVAMIIFSTGKDGALPASSQGPHELANTDGDAAFISRTPTDSSATTGAYDDLMLWIPVGVLYSKLIAAGVLP